MIFSDGWQVYTTWEHSPTCDELYKKRSLMLTEEMTSSAQAADLLGSIAKSGESVLDVGCGSGYFFHSLKSRNLNLDYYGLDACGKFIATGQEVMPQFGLSKDRLKHLRIEDFRGEFDHVVCLNTLTFLDHFYRPLDRMLKSARKSIILRESMKEEAEYNYVIDKYLDSPIPLRTPINHYSKSEISKFISEAGFKVDFITDKRTGGKPEISIDHPHYWTFLLGVKN